MLSLICGIWHAKTHNPLSLVTQLVIIAFFMLLFWQKKQRRLLVAAGICAATFPVGFIIFNTHLYTYTTSQKQLIGRPVEIIATISDITTQPDARWQEKIVARVQAYRYHHNATWRRAACNIMLHTQQQNALQVDDTVRLRPLTLQKGNDGPSMGKSCTFNDFLFKENIIGSVFCRALTPVWRKRPPFSLARAIDQLRNKLCLRIESKCTGTTALYFTSMFFGKKRPELTEHKHLFSYWGLLHYLARSGLHVILFIAVWQLLFSLLPCPLIVKNVTLLLLTILYLILSWPSISFYRAFWVFVVAQCGKILQRPVHLLHLLTLTCIATVIVNPMHVFFLDFQLSFGLTFTLMLAATLANRRGLVAQ